MKRITVIMMLGIGIFLLFGGLVACDDTPQSSTALTATVNGPTPTHIAINTTSQKILTLADNNQKITVKPGTTIELELDDKAYSNWLVSISQANILIPWANAPMPAHVQGIFNAGQPGTAQISATGQPNCTANVASCSKKAQTFQVQINVG